MTAVEQFTIGDVTTGGANFMLGWLSPTIAAGESIDAAKWQEAIRETVAFQLRMMSRAPSTGGDA